MRIVVTGGAGFIGSHLCGRLLDDGHEVVCVDNLLTGSERHVELHQDREGFSFIKHNISEPLFLDGGIDAVMHFASPASPIDFPKLPIQILKVGALGAWHTLGMAKEKGARFMLASTSEVYGDPKVSPQPETYWGHVNPIGPRGVYDEAKRYAEAMTMAYHRAHDIDTRIVRIFNSILADEQVIAFDNGDIVIEQIGDYAGRVAMAPSLPREVLVPAFDPNTMKMELRKASALIQHPAQQEAFELRLRYGRSVKVTGDHSVFTKGSNGSPRATPVREIQKGDHVLIPARLPVVERDRTSLDLVQMLHDVAERGEELWNWKIEHDSFPSVIEERSELMYALAATSGRYEGTNNFRNAVGCAVRKWHRNASLPLAILHRADVEVPADARVKPLHGASRSIPARVELTEDLLWFLGFYLAEGTAHASKGRYLLSLSSDLHFLRRAKAIVEDHFEVSVGLIPPADGRAPSIYFNSRVLYELFVRALGMRDRRIPSWVMQLPLARVKHFLEGFRCGDGTHSGKKLGNELVFDTPSEQLAIDLNYLLLRFGIVASFGRYSTTFKKKYGDRRFPFYRLTICELDTFDILEWDRGVRQTLNANRLGDMVWAKVREVRPCMVTGNVYDFSVPGHENFIAGNGVACHNTFGPRMRPDDGRAIPQLASQALAGEPMTVHGDGSQTRSFCYVSDLVEGIVRLLYADDIHDPVNIGNPVEMTVLELAQLIKELTASDSEIVFTERPVDDPMQRRPDITRARELLGWEPVVELRDGLTRTLDSFRALR